MTPTIALALEDFAPVLLTLLALIWLNRIVYEMDRPSGHIALLGSILIVLGGLLKATSKLIWAVSGTQILWMDRSLFLLMAPGFGCVAWALWCGQGCLFRRTRPRFVWQVPLLFSLLVGGGAAYFYHTSRDRMSFFILLTLVVLASSLMLILLAFHAWRYRNKMIASLFLLYLIITLALDGMARTSDGTIGMEWAKQLVNTAAAALLAFGSWRLWRATRPGETRRLS
jgi:hypothetical protein